MNWLKVNFSQVFSAWLHLKALRVFSESILRYVNQLYIIMMKYNKICVNGISDGNYY